MQADSWSLALNSITPTVGCLLVVHQKQQGPDEEGHCSGDGRTAAGSGPCWLAASGTLYLVPGAVCTTAHWTCQALIHQRVKLASARSSWHERTSDSRSASRSADRRPLLGRPARPESHPRRRLRR